MAKQTAVRAALAELVDTAPILGTQATFIYDGITSMILEESHRDYLDAMGTLELLAARLAAHRVSLETAERCKRDAPAAADPEEANPIWGPVETLNSQTPAAALMVRSASQTPAQEVQSLRRLVQDSPALK